MSEKPYTPSTDEVRAGWITGETRDGLGVDHDDLQPGVAAEFDAWLAKVKDDAVREHEEKRVVIHMDPPQPRLVPVPAPCPRCGWSR